MSETGRLDYLRRRGEAWPKIAGWLRSVYGEKSEYALDSLGKEMDRAFEARSNALRLRDRERVGWHRSQTLAAVSLYTNLFAGDFSGVRKRLAYLKELGIGLVHFMPLLKPRDGENDGGYAVADYRRTDPRLGTMDDFEVLVAEMDHAGMACCVDFVINHTAYEHEWAVAARRGDPEAQAMYLLYENREIPDRFEETVPEVFPGVAPGNFTWCAELKRWVFTSFYAYQWDLNYRNPRVLIEVIGILFFLANLGVAMIRLDAIPFIWKDLGTSCRNRPTVHTLLKIFHAASQVVCPSVVLLGEAIVKPEEIVKYFGDGEPECPVMYNATGMVNLWNSLATRETSLLYADHNRLTVPAAATWINYARCHDDIGWGFNEEAIAAKGLDPAAHKQFLISFYQGVFEGSFSKGELYEFDPETLDARNSGTLASLCGLQRALEEKDSYQVELSVKRIKLLHAYIVAARGLPLFYSGDEVAVLNDYSYLYQAGKSHDSRWLHRSSFNWGKAARRHEAGSPEHEVFQDLRLRLAARAREALFHGDVAEVALDLGNSALFATHRCMKERELVCIFNFSEDRQFFDTHMVQPIIKKALFTEIIEGRSVSFRKPRIAIGPYQALWLVS